MAGTPAGARVEWRRSDRARRVGLRIDPMCGHVIVTLPPRTARRVGLALLASHAEWVAARIAALPPAIAFTDGNAIRLAGRRIRIRQVVHVDESQAEGSHVSGVARVHGRELLVTLDGRPLAAKVEGFLLDEAKTRFGALVAKKAARAALRPRRMVLKDMRTRWGSCAADRTLVFNWRLVMAPPFVQDYVVAHEVAHLRHMDHGPQFKILERELSRFVDPARAWLRRHGPGLLRVG